MQYRETHSLCGPSSLRVSRAGERLRLTLQFLQHRHLHLQHLLGLLRRLHLQGHVLPRQQVQGFVNLAEAATADLLELRIKKTWVSS